jgi:hypothetical protein
MDTVMAMLPRGMVEAWIANRSGVVVDAPGCQGCG